LAFPALFSKRRRRMTRRMGEGEGGEREAGEGRERLRRGRMIK